MSFLAEYNSASETVLQIVRTVFQYAWEIPWHIDFFMFPFTFGHVIYGLIFVDVSLIIVKHLLKTNDSADGYYGL